jgi:uncharacterized protein YjbI with pentapeptide repeats
LLRSTKKVFIPKYDCVIDFNNPIICDPVSLVESILSLFGLSARSLCTVAYVRVGLRDCEFHDANFESCNFQQADIFDCFNEDLTSVNAWRAYFVNADHSGAILTGGNFEDANFEDAKLIGVVWKGAKITGTIFSDDSIREEISRQI